MFMPAQFYRGVATILVSHLVTMSVSGPGVASMPEIATTPVERIHYLV